MTPAMATTQLGGQPSGGRQEVEERQVQHRLQVQALIEIEKVVL